MTTTSINDGCENDLNPNYIVLATGLMCSHCWLTCEALPLWSCYVLPSTDCTSYTYPGIQAQDHSSVAAHISCQSRASDNGAFHLENY